SVGSLAGEGSLALGSGTTTFTVGSSLTNDTVFSGVISGGANAQFTKTGPGRFTLPAANTHAGQTNVSQGTLVAAHDNALGTTGKRTTVSAGATLGLAGGINISGESVPLNAGTTATALRNVSGDNTLGGTVTLVNSSNTMRI